MKISIRTHFNEKDDLSPELVVRRIEFALDAFRDRVRSVWVSVADVNGPRGGVDKSCQITAGVRGMGDFVVSENAASAASAFGRAVKRLKYRVAEGLRHRRSPKLETIRRAERAA